MTAAPPLRVCIDARISGFDGRTGGAQHVVLALARAFSGFDTDTEQYVFLTYGGHDDWLTPSLTGPCTALPTMRPPPMRAQPARRPPVAQRLRASWWEVNRRLGNPRTVHLERSDGTIEGAGIDVMHFTLPPAFLTDVPSLYLPHDLQHRHHPENFSRAERTFRDVVYGGYARQARAVVALTPWGRRDLIEQLHLPPEKVVVVPWAAAAKAAPEPDALEGVRRRFALPERFLLFPAQLWPHKNHARLIAAVARLRDERGLPVCLVCSGHRLESHYPTLDRLVRRLDVGDLVRFTGFVSEDEFAGLLALSAGVAFPSTFEGWGLPVTEALAAGKPVACSRIPVLEQVAGTAARYFDPLDERSIADALVDLWTNPELAATLAVRGRERVAMFSWDRTARLLRAHYRRVAGRELGEDDQALLAQPFPQGGDAVPGSAAVAAS